MVVEGGLGDKVCKHFYEFIMIYLLEWGAWEASESLKIYRFQTLCMNSAVGLAAQELMKISGFLCILIVQAMG